MAVSQSNAYKNERRNYNKSLYRQGLFIHDYIKTKYGDIYTEAATFYNQLNQEYPRKPDLRKTVEFRRWINNMAVEKNIATTPIPRQKHRTYVNIKHPDIQIDNITSPLRITASPLDIAPRDLSAMEISIPEEIQNPVPQNSPQAENQQSDKSIDSRITAKTMQLNIPLMRISTPKPTQQPDQSITTAYGETIVDQGDQPEALNPSIIGEIPPDSTPKPAQQPDQSITTAYEETIVDQGDQPEALNPSIIGEIPPETMEKIIHELQNDPNLSQIMEDIEKSLDVQEEIIGLTIDLPDLEDPLEDELMWW